MSVCRVSATIGWEVSVLEHIMTCKNTSGMSVYSKEYTYPILIVITEMIVKGGLSTTLNPERGGVRGHRL
jgi:hypothetical protein